MQRGCIILLNLYNTEILMWAYSECVMLQSLYSHSGILDHSADCRMQRVWLEDCFHGTS